MKLKYVRLRPTAVPPAFKTELAAGMDLSASLEGLKGISNTTEYVLMPNEVKAIPLGIAVQLEPGYEMAIKSRSNMLLKGITTMSYVLEEGEEKEGTIDADYRGEVHAILCNNSRNAFVIENNTRICQAVIRRVETPANGLEMEEVAELDKTERGTGKFGSTGN